MVRPLQEYLQLADMTPYRFAEEIGVERKNVYNWLNHDLLTVYVDFNPRNYEIKKVTREKKEVIFEAA